MSKNAYAEQRSQTSNSGEMKISWRTLSRNASKHSKQPKKSVSCQMPILNTLPIGAKACAKGNACRHGPNAIKSICPSGVAPRLTLLPLQGVLLGLEPNPGCRSRKTYGFQSLCPGLCARCPCRAPQLTSCPSVEAVPIICVNK